MKNSILKLAVVSLLSLTIISCAQKHPLSPSVKVVDVSNSLNTDSINIFYVIRILSVDLNSDNNDLVKTTNLVNDIGYTYKDISGNWIRVVKYGYDGRFMQVHQGQIIRGTFKVPAGLNSINFQSQLFLLTTNTGDVAMNPQNIATLQVFEDGNIIVDKSPSGIPANYFNWIAPYKWDLSALTPLHR